ncbi:MAG TPA: pentapeptide repeat-containing protein [Kofleriaceae bacterium]|nr:pentapeptide repeat-containing protein [Kofleriaceae bacterium]
MSREPPRFSEDEPAVTVLHLSDMQFGRNHRFADPGGGFDTLLHRLRDDLDLLARDHGLNPDLIALTGDLAEWGMRTELEQVAQLGEGLLAHLGLEPDRLLIIPGNHDVNRRSCEAYFLECEGDGEKVKPPYWPKWKHYVGLVNRLYRDRNVDRYRFTELEPWTWFEIPSLKVVVAGLNSTMHESHREADHHGFVGEPQLRWFKDRLEDYERKGWLRIGLVHHNAVRRAGSDDENLKDADDLREYLGELLHVLLHGHTHQGRVEMLGPSLPVIATGSAAVRRDQRPGPSAELPGETPNQYQIVRITRGGLWCAAREYTFERKRWIGDTRISRHGDSWWYEYKRTWERAEATFPPPAPPGSGGTPPASGPGPGDGEPPARTPLPFAERARDLLDDVIDWFRIRGDRSAVDITRIAHRGPWGDYAQIRHREGGMGLIGAFSGELTADVLERWIADVHDPFRGRGQPVSKLVVAAAKIDPALRSAAQARGVEVERMIDYQRVLDIVGYGDRLRDWLDHDLAYPSTFYLEQQMTVWSPVAGATHREPVGHAADWVAARLREHEGAFMLVLGPAGVGKTFLLREVARRLSVQQAITPILIELRDLERAHDIEELAATQFTRFGVPWHPRAFRRDLEEGRLALLFDGFDELALRVRSAAIPAHFERIYGAAVERARIVVSSRTEHFISTGQVADLMTTASAAATPLSGQLARVPRRQVLEVHPFERDDVAAYLRRRLGDEAGDERFARLSRVHDLVGLARNPRMLAFLVDIPDAQLARATGLAGSVTSDALYRIVIDDAWLAAEAARLAPPGAAPGPTASALHDAASNLALQLWRDPSGRLTADDIAAHAGGLLLRMCDDDRDVAVQTARTRTLLTRDDRGRISFVHQTVLEWLVVGQLAAEITGAVASSHLEVGRLNAFMIDLLQERLGDTALVRWAEARLAAPASNAVAENAREVLKRLNHEATSRVSLRDQDLRGQDLGGQSLRGADLDGADLTGARLVERDLTGASFVGAQLAYADFTHACLRDVDLSDANLSFARFHRADLMGARLSGARLTGASFVGAKGVPLLVGSSAVGMALQAPPSVDAMYARASWGGCRIAISRDGAILASGHTDGTVQLWDWRRGQAIRSLHGHAGGVWSVAFSPDHQIVMTGGDDDTVRLWNVSDGRERARLSGHGGSAWSVAFSPDGQRVASGCADGAVRLWSVKDGREVLRIPGHRGRVLSVAFSPDGQLLATGDDEGARLWDARDGNEVVRLSGHRGSVWSVAFSPDGSLVASGSSDETARLWSVADGREQRQLTGHHGSVLSVVFSQDGQTVASGSDGVVLLWNIGARRERARLTGHRGSVWSLAFAPDGQTLASGGADATIRLWHVAEARERTRLNGHRGSVLSVAFSGRTIASVVDEAVGLWNLKDGRETGRLTGHRGRVLSVAVSQDGQLVASGGDDETVRLWGAEDGRARGKLTGHRGRVLSVAFSSDSQTLASGGADETVRLWNIKNGEERAMLSVNGARALSLVFSRDGQMIAVGGDDETVRLLSVRDRRERAQWTGHRGAVWSVAFSRNGQLVASSDDERVRLWSVSDGREHARLAGQHGPVSSVAFAPDGRTIASGDGEMVRLWSTTDWRERTRLIGHLGRVLSVAFSSDNQLLASGGADGTVRLWNVASGRCLATLYATTTGSVAVRPDGRFRVSGNVAGQFWHVIGLHRFEVGELDELIPGLRLGDGEPLLGHALASASAS